MKWYHSLKFKNIFFFVTIGLFFVLAIVIALGNIKERRLGERANSAVVVATSGVIQELLKTQHRNEQIVEDIADVAGVHISKEILKKLLDVPQKDEVVSGGLWFEPFAIDKDKKNLSYFFHREEGGGFEEVSTYSQKLGISYRKMEFYVLGRQLKEGETFWTKVYTDPVTKVRMVTVVAPIYKKSLFIGVASVDLKLSLNQKKTISDLLHSDEKYFFLTDRVGTPILKSIDMDINSSKKNIAELKKLILKNLNISHQHAYVKAPLVKELLSESQDFTLQEAQQIAFELDHLSGLHKESIQTQSILVKDDPIFHERSVVTAFYMPHTSWYMLVGIPEHRILGDIIEVYREIIVVTALFALLAALLGYLLVRSSIVRPIQDISEQVRALGTHTDVKIETDDRGEIGLLVESFNIKTEALRVAKEREQQNERLLLQQSKMAAMGEMLDAVAHQWKQPLNALSMYAELIQIDYEEGIINQEYIEQFQKDIETQINHMTDTLGTFRSFFRPSTALAPFDLRSVIDDVLLLAKDELTKHTINVSVEEETALELYGSSNEFKHLLLNIINNAKDAFIENEIKERQITIRTIGGERPRLEVEDSAGGIPESIIDNVFQAHFTTKESGKGTGIGLYMSVQITEKHHAKLQVENREKGACFIVLFSPHSFSLG